MTENPYAAPGTQVLDSGVDVGRTRLYSPFQVAGGALLGGPVGLIYFLWTNFKVLRNERLAKRTLVFGAFLILALLLILPLLPEEFPSAPIALAYMFVGRYVADKHQMNKMGIAASTGFAFHSNWRVFGLGLLCMLASVIIIAVPLVYLAFLRG